MNRKKDKKWMSLKLFLCKNRMNGENNQIKNTLQAIFQITNWIKKDKKWITLKTCMYKNRINWKNNRITNII